MEFLKKLGIKKENFGASTGLKWYGSKKKICGMTFLSLTFRKTFSLFETPELCLTELCSFVSALTAFPRT